jgi:hypothetical protein
LRVQPARAAVLVRQAQHQIPPSSSARDHFWSLDRARHFFRPCACGKDQGSPRELELPPGPHPGLLPFALKPHGNHVLSTWGRISFEGQRNLNVLPGHLRVGAIEWRSREIGPRLYCQFEIRAQKPCVQACGTSQGDYPGKVSGEKCILGARQSRCNLTNEPRLTP